MAFDFNMYKNGKFWENKQCREKTNRWAGMSVMNGEDATKAIRENEGEGKHVPIIALTADAIAGVKEKLLEAGMDDYIVKPIDFVVLSGVLKKYLPKEKVKG